jgi:hypothetical protein
MILVLAAAVKKVTGGGVWRELAMMREQKIAGN